MACSSTSQNCERASPPLPLYKRRAGMLCFRRTVRGDDVSEVDTDFEFLLISRRSQTFSDSFTEVSHDKYTIPAGKFEAGMDASCEDCAVREALEEAGVACHIAADLGWHASSSKKHGEPVQTRYFLGHCVRLLDSWLEDGSRERLWLPPTAAMQKLSYREDLADVISKGHEALRIGAGCNAALLQGTMPTGKEHLLPANSCMQDALVREADGERFVNYPHQVGGHFRMVKPAPGTRLEVELPLRPQREHQETGCLQQAFARPNVSSGESCHISGSNVVLKPFDEHEAQFYCHTLSDGRLSSLQPFVPLFYGTKRLNREQIEVLAFSCKEKQDKLPGHFPPDVDRADRESKQPSPHKRRYLVLEDLGSSASQPCFLDLKIGCRQRSVRHDTQKRAHMATKAEQSTSATLGFRVCGMQCFDKKSGHVKRFDKYWGQKVTLESMSKTLAMFFSLGLDEEPGPLVGVSAAIVEAVVDKLGRLELILQQLPGKRFWGSSVLIVFNASAAAEGNLESCISSVRIKIIDFANFQDVGSSLPDLEFLCGINNARIFLQELLRGQLLDSPPANQLVPPPPSEVQDLEQETARQLFKFAKTTPVSLGSMGDDDAGDDEVHLVSNAQTISGATGRTLMREIAPRHMVIPEGGDGTPFAAGNRSPSNSMEGLFD